MADKEVTCFCDPREQKTCLKHPESRPAYCRFHAVAAPQAELANPMADPTDPDFNADDDYGAAPAETVANRDGHWCPHCKTIVYAPHVCGETAGEMIAEQRQYNELEARYFSDKLMDAAEIGDLRAQVSDLERERDEARDEAVHQNDLLKAAELKLGLIAGELGVKEADLVKESRLLWLWPGRKSGALREGRTMEIAAAINTLMRIHYNFFMANQRFWYDRDLRDADSLIVITASNLRNSLAVGGAAGSRVDGA